MEEMKKREERTEKQMAEIVAENKRLAEPLARARSELDDCRKQVRLNSHIHIFKKVIIFSWLYKYIYIYM